MEKIAEANLSLLARLPMAVQSTLRSLPLSDYSVLLLLTAVGAIGISFIFSYSSGYEYPPIQEFDEVPVRKQEKQVKVKILNTKKNRRGKRKSKGETDSPVVEESPEPQFIDNTEDHSWEEVIMKKPKKRNQ